MSRNNYAPIPQKRMPITLSRLLLAVLTIMCATTTTVPASPLFQWDRLTDFPQSKGLKGYFALYDNSEYFLLGGSTFLKPVSEGGEKTYFDTIYQLRLSARGEVQWATHGQQLPFALSEGATVNVDNTAIMIGGLNQYGIVDSVTRVYRDSPSATLHFGILPPLPTPCYYPAAAAHESTLYVAGGHDGAGGLSDFLALNLNDMGSGWRRLPACPGSPRFGSILEVLHDGQNTFLYLFSGKSQTTSPRSQDNYLKDVYRFDLDTEMWERMDDMPRAALIGIPGKIDDHTLAIFSGSDGHDIDKLSEIGDAYRLPDDILIYNAKTDSWSSGGKMPLGVIGVPLLPAESGFLLASGEYSPGLRSDAVYRIRIKPSAQK